MLNLLRIHSITEFQRNPKAILAKLKISHDPVVLTVNGRAELVVQTAESYQALLDKVRAAEDSEAIREGLGQSLLRSGRPAEEFFTDFEASHGL